MKTQENISTEITVSWDITKKVQPLSQGRSSCSNILFMAYLKTLSVAQAIAWKVNY
jgi:hypothetical protein